MKIRAMMATGAILVSLAALSRASAIPEPARSSSGAAPLVASAVASMLSHYHYGQRPLDDRISEQWLERYLDMLDPNHMVFLQQDISEFGQWEHLLDDDTRSFNPKLDAATTIYDRFRQRYAERTEQVMELLDTDVDLTDEEVFVYDRSEAPWPATAAEARELWRLRLEQEVVLGHLRGEEREEIVSLLRDRYRRILGDLEQHDSLDVLEIYLSALGNIYDPHSLYMKPASSDNFDIDMSNSVTGIGAQLRTIGPYTTVNEVIAGGPADLDGRLQAGDKIIAVSQGPGTEAVDIIDRRIDDVVKLIRGEVGTTVVLRVIPSGEDASETVEIDIVRDQVVLEEALASKSIREIEQPDGSRMRVGVIDVPSFYGPPTGEEVGTVSDDVERLLGELKEEGVDAVLLDMRRNGGGLLSEALRMAGLFIPSGPIVQVRDPDGRVEQLRDPDRGKMAYSGPLAVLTSPWSASAAEIVAGSLQDYGRAVIVGSKTTHGKGTVQTLLDPAREVKRIAGVNVREDLGIVKLTVQMFYLPSGDSTQLRGVRSDVVLPSPADGMEMLEAHLDNPLPWDEIAPARYRPVGNLEGLLPELRERSAERVASSEEMQELKEDIAEYIDVQQRSSVSLNLETRRAERAARQDDEEAEEVETEDLPDPVLDEAVAVAADLVRLSG